MIQQAYGREFVRAFESRERERRAWENRQEPKCDRGGEEG